MLWPLGLSYFSLWAEIVKVSLRFTDIRQLDIILKHMSHAIPSLLGVKVGVKGNASLMPDQTYVYVANHVNIFDMFVLYQAIPGFTRALEHIDHFSWPLFGSFITAVGQIPVDPKNPRQAAKSLRKAATMLNAGESITVLPEGSRTLDGSLGHFYPGAFRLAIKAGVPVVPMAIRGGRSVSRRGDWRIRPGREEVLLAAPVSTSELRVADAPMLAEKCRQIIIDLIQGRRKPGE